MRCCAGASLESLSPRATKCPAKRSSTTQAIIDGSAPRDSLRAFPCVCRQLLRLRTPLRGLRRLRCCWPGVRRRAGRLPRYSGGNEYVAAVLQPHCLLDRVSPYFARIVWIALNWIAIYWALDLIARMMYAKRLKWQEDEASLAITSPELLVPFAFALPYIINNFELL